MTDVWRVLQRRVTILPSGCWYYHGAHSQSGGRGVFYPVLRLGPTVWRLNRLMLILCWGNVRYPRLVEEPLFAWLQRVNQAYRADEASHTCDQAWCIAPLHLEWRDHRANIAEQRLRREVA